MSGQLSFTTIGGEVVTTQQRGKHYVQPRGYASPVGSGPAGETCKTCGHLTRITTGGRRSFPKCELTRFRWTHGRASDILVNAPACKQWEAAKP